MDEQVINELITKLPSSSGGWYAAIAGMLIFIVASVLLKRKQDGAAHDEDKHLAGGKALSDAQNDAVEQEAARKEVDDFLDRQ